MCGCLRVPSDAGLLGVAAPSRDTNPVTAILIVTIVVAVLLAVLGSVSDPAAGCLGTVSVGVLALITYAAIRAFAGVSGSAAGLIGIVAGGLATLGAWAWFVVSHDPEDAVQRRWQEQANERRRRGAFRTDEEWHHYWSRGE